MAQKIAVTVSYNNGRPDVAYDSIQEAVTALLTEYPDGVCYDAGGWSHDADDDDSAYGVRNGRVGLVWPTEAAAVDDAGAAAAASIDLAAEVR